MQEINAWLKSEQDFNEGVCLYEKYGTNTFFLKLLYSEGPTQYNTEKLGAELEVLAPALPAIPQQNVAIKNVYFPKDPQTPAATTPKSNSEDFPRYLELKELLKTTYRQLERNMMELDLSTNEKILHLTAKNILSLDQKIRDIYKLLDYYDENGKLPVTRKIEVVRTPVEEIQLLRQSSSKAKQRLKAPGCRDVKGTQALIETNTKRIIELGGKVKS